MKADIIYNCGRSTTQFLEKEPARATHSYDLTTSLQDIKEFDADIYPFDLWTGLLQEEDEILMEEYDQLPEEFIMYEELFELIWKSPVARSILRFAAEEGWAMTMQSLDQASS